MRTTTNFYTYLFLLWRTAKHTSDDVIIVYISS